MLEQMGPFLAGMWLYANFVDATIAGYLGLAYVFIRAFYYLAYVNGTVLVLFVTLPNYTIVFYYFGAIAYRLLYVFGVLQ